jgi:predicted RNase H-like nuclease (RuvC/YqgF family)
MPTQEERITALEQALAELQKEVAILPKQEKRITTLEQKTAAAIQETEENTTIMSGVIRSQGQDIRKIFQRLETVDENINQLKTTLNEHTTLLTQILARLPEKP